MGWGIIYLFIHPKKQQLESIVEHKEGRKEGSKQGRKRESLWSQIRVSMYVSIRKLTFGFVTVVAAFGDYISFHIYWA